MIRRQDGHYRLRVTFLQNDCRQSHHRCGATRFGFKQEVIRWYLRRLLLSFISLRGRCDDQNMRWRKKPIQPLDCDLEQSPLFFQERQGVFGVAFAGNGP